MELSKIISVLRKPEHVYEGEGFPKESYDLDTRKVLELDEDQNRLYNAILKTIPKSTLSGLRDTLGDCPWSLLEKIEWMSQDHPREDNVKRNEPIGTLLKLFLNKSSKKVGYARKGLTSRFDKQSYRDQNKILRAFLRSGSGDCDWAGKILRDNWRKELTEEVKEAWTRTRRLMLAYVILRHMPNDYILSEQEELSKAAGYQYVCAVVGNEPGFTIDMERLAFPEYMYVMAKLGRKVDFEEAETKMYNFLLSYDKYYDVPPYRTPGFSSIRGWDRMVWAMGVLGMQDALVRLLEFENKVKENTPKDVHGFEAWAYFVTAIKDQIDPFGDPYRLAKELESCNKAEQQYFGLSDGEESIYEDLPVVSEGQLFRTALDEKPDMTLSEEWTLFAEAFYKDNPRLQSYLLDAEIVLDGGIEVIVIPVFNALQEDWFKAGPLDEIRELFERKTRFPRSHYSITIKRKDPDENL